MKSLAHQFFDACYIPRQLQRKADAMVKHLSVFVWPVCNAAQVAAC